MPDVANGRELGTWLWTGERGFVLPPELFFLLLTTEV